MEFASKLKIIFSYSRFTLHNIIFRNVQKSFIATYMESMRKWDKKKHYPKETTVTEVKLSDKFNVI